MIHFVGHFTLQGAALPSAGRLICLLQFIDESFSFGQGRNAFIKTILFSLDGLVDTIDFQIDGLQ